MTMDRPPEQQSLLPRSDDRRDAAERAIPASSSSSSTTTSSVLDSPSLDWTQVRKRRCALILAAVAVAALIAIATSIVISPEHDDPKPAPSPSPPPPPLPPDAVRVPFEAHIMSKCPDAQHCLQKLVLPVMERMHEKVDFRLSFIGNYSSTSDDIACLHGPEECLGDMILLCAANLPASVKQSTQSAQNTAAPSPPITGQTASAPKIPVVRSLGFANCLVSSYSYIPDRSLVEDCALEHGISFEALNHCMSRVMETPPSEDDNPEKPSGLALVRRSFQHSMDVNATKSCTIRLDEKIWCVRDDGHWSDCGRTEAKRSDVGVVVDETERLWTERNKDLLRSS